MAGGIRGWDEMSQAERDHMIAWVKEEFRFSTKPVDDETREIVLHTIEQEGLTPFSEGSSLHCWDACYQIGANYYKLWGALGHEDVNVDEIIDSAPEKGPIHETYKG